MADAKDGNSNDDAVFYADAYEDEIREAFELFQHSPELSFAKYLELAERGSVWSMVQVGNALWSGDGVARDLAAAELWFTRAYEHSSAKGLLRGARLAWKRGDEKTARAMLDDGIARNLFRAWTLLAQIELKSGNKQRALALYELAVSAGDVYAKGRLGRLMLLGRFGLARIPEGYRLLRQSARELVQRADARLADVTPVE